MKKYVVPVFETFINEMKASEETSLKKKLDKAILEWKTISDALEKEAKKYASAVKDKAAKESQLKSDVEAMLTKLGRMDHEVDGLVVKMSKAYDRENIQWKAMFDALIKKVNPIMKQYMNKLIEENKKISKVKGSIELKSKDAKVEEGLVDTVKGWLKSIISGFKSLLGYNDRLESAVEAMKEASK